jgi:glutathione S-transferase
MISLWRLGPRTDLDHRFQTYFPHIDNVYSHRSTQRHKRKRFVSHYWDCRLKGRPPGTKKSTDPDKKKRKRIARERDLCDVKIKITEFFDRREYEEQLGRRPPGTENDPPSPIASNMPINPGLSGGQNQNPQFFGQPPLLPQQPAGTWDVPPNMGSQSGMNMQEYPTSSGSSSKKFYTFQRVNGNGGNGKGDGVAGPHKHTLEESDRVKKNSVIRWQAKIDKDDRRKMQVSLLDLVRSQTPHSFVSTHLAMIICNGDPLCPQIKCIRHFDAC